VHIRVGGGAGNSSLEQGVRSSIPKGQRNEGNGFKQEHEQIQLWNSKRLDRLADAAASGEYAGWEDQGHNLRSGEYNEEDEEPHEIQEEEGVESTKNTKN
jgi:hypothetical protein